MERPARSPPLSPRELDEDDVRVRPGRGSRPRTKQRPKHQDATPATVIAVDRGRFTCRIETPDGPRTVTAMRARDMGRSKVVVGDRAALVGDLSGAEGTLARIVRIEERTSMLRRTADDDDPYERIIVANADQLIIVTALADPPPRTGFIDRCLVAAFAGNLRPVLCLTKSDLADPGPLLATYSDLLGVEAVSTRHDADPVDLRERLPDQTSVMIGHSGVGKLTLVNRLVPDAGRAVSRVSAVGKGRHTSSSAVALELPDGGWVIDTPGVRSFGLAHVSPADVLVAFPDLQPGTADCPRSCDHSGPEVECALDEWVAQGHAEPARLESYRRLIAQIRG